MTIILHTRYIYYLAYLLIIPNEDKTKSMDLLSYFETSLCYLEWPAILGMSGNFTYMFFLTSRENVYIKETKNIWNTNQSDSSFSVI